MNFASIDFETANEKRDSACAIGIAIVEAGKVVSRFHSLIRPTEMRFAGMNVAIHGITEDDVANAPTLAELWDEIKQLLKGFLVVAHNASFDMSVLRYSLHANGVPFPELEYLCSLKLSSRVWPTLACHRLAFLAEHYGIQLDHHNAESDAVAAAELVLRAGGEHSVSCPYKLAEQFEVSVGQITCDGSWRPSSAPSVQGVERVIIAFPEGFRIECHPLFAKRIVFTGTLKTMKRSNAEELVSQVGGFATDSVSKSTDFLICGTQDLRMLAKSGTESSKLKKAKSLRDAGAPIQILGEDEFLRLLFDPCNE